MPVNPTIQFQRRNNGFNWKLTFEPRGRWSDWKRRPWPLGCQPAFVISHETLIEEIARAETLGQLVEFVYRQAARGAPLIAPMSSKEHL
jgi:hypothetical protein